MEFVASALDRIRKIKLVIFDVDGVLTDGGLYVGAQGESMKRFYVKDGLAITLARQAGLKTAIITGRYSAMVEQRAKELSIDAVWQGCGDKCKAYRELKKKFNFGDEEIAYIGDDLLDLPIMLQVGFAAAVGDAAAEVKHSAHLIAAEDGGHGAVREILEFVLKTQNKWENVIAGFRNTSITETPAH